MGYITTKYQCPLDGSLLFFDRGEDNDAYICSHCSTIYPTLSRQEADILKDLESQALSRLEQYKNKLEEIKKEEGEIVKIFEFTKKSGLFSKLNEANLSENKRSGSVVNMKEFSKTERNFGAPTG